MTYTIGIILFVVGLLVGALFVWIIRQKEIESIKKSEEDLKDSFSSLSRMALDENQKSFFELARNQFENLTKSSDQQLDEKKKEINTSIKDVKEQLEKLRKETNSLTGHLENSQKGISELSDTTSKLRQILSSSQARGQWGERMVEDILNFIGLIEGRQYEKQKSTAEGRPDFTFYLPDNSMINMDVKFPFVHYEKYIFADTEIEKESEKKQFLKDVRNHIIAISKRDYIDPKGGTVDYVLMFIPNESIYNFINQEDIEIIDFSLSNKIILCSPITLYAILSLIRQTYSNLRLERKAGEMQKLVGSFTQQWQLFIEKMDAMGKSIESAQKNYDTLVTTRTRQLEKPMEKINEIQLEQPKEIEK